MSDSLLQRRLAANPNAQNTSWSADYAQQTGTENTVQQNNAVSESTLQNDTQNAQENASSNPFSSFQMNSWSAGQQVNSQQNTGQTQNTQQNPFQNTQFNFQNQNTQNQQNTQENTEERTTNPFISKKTSYTEEELEAKETEDQELQMEEHRKFSVFTRIFNFCMIVACIYVLFLIYGVAVTNFGYNDDGEVEAIRMSVSDIAELEAFNDVYYQYLKCRNLYEEVLLLDYRIEKGEEDAMTVATEYEALLDDVENLSVKTEAMVVDSKYSQIQSLMLEWIQDDIAVYLQNMSAAISENDSETAANALEDQTRVYSNFSTLTMNMAAIGETIKGADIDELDDWSPETYIDEEINGTS